MKHSEGGFTLIELMATVTLLSIMLTLGVGALRYFWLGQSLTSGQDEIFTNLRGLQQQVVSESNPLVFGAWFEVAGGDDGDPEWGTFRFNPTTNNCTSTGDHTLDGGVQVASADFVDTLSGAPLGDVAAACTGGAGQIPAAAAATDLVIFLARGTATAGCVSLTQVNREMDDVWVAVSTLTGRVERIEQDEVAARCP